jgi:preprotein translocase subunit SecA
LKKHASTSGDEFQFGHADLEEFLNEQAVQSLTKIDLSQAREFLLPEWGRRSLSDWVHHKFTIIIDPAGWADFDRAEIIRRVRDVARDIYAQKEAELPTRIALVKYLGDRSQHQNPRYDREGLAVWASSRYHAEIKEEDLRPLLRPEIEDRLIALAHQNYQGARLYNELESKLAAIKPAGASPDKNGTPADPHALADLVSWARQSLQIELKEDDLHSMSTTEIRRTLFNALDAKERPEMREMEKAVLLQILDSSWMEHLRAMDHLRSSIGLQGYAQIDPKVEYKREGMRIFAEMWNGIGDRVTDLIFRVEQFDPEFLTYLGSQWKLDRAQTIHQQADSQLAPSADKNGVRNQQDAAIASSQRSPEKKREPVRNLAKKVGRNDPCPCGSGKKFKACHMRKQSTGDPF